MEPLNKLEDHTWRRFTGPYHLMMTLMVGSYLAMPFMGDSLIGGLLVLASFSLALVLGIRASGSSPWHLRIALGVIAFTALAVVWEVMGVDTFEGRSLPGLLRVLMALLIFIGVKTTLAHALRAGHVDTDKIFAAIGALFLLALFWGYVYMFLDESLIPDQELFSGSQGAAATLEVSERQVELFYFSIITLTTVGYGDITPIHPVSRSLASLEGLTGQLYLTVLVARLVALHISHSREKRD